MIEIVVFAEAQSDQRIACGIADRILLAHSPEHWEEREDTASPELARCRKWSGLNEGETFFDLHHYKDHSRNNPRRFTRKPKGQSVGYDFALVRIAAQLCVEAAKNRPFIRGFLLVRDMDSQSEKRNQSADDAANEVENPSFLKLFARPNPCMEAWLLNGFECSSAAESKVFQEVTRELQLDPTTDAHRLRAASEGEARSPKRVLRKLTDGNRDRVDACWERPALHQLWLNGKETGLREFCELIEAVLVPKVSELTITASPFRARR
jgi:hypothetical protein